MPLTFSYLSGCPVNESRARDTAARLGIDLGATPRPEACPEGTLGVILDADHLLALGFDLQCLLKALTDPDGRCRVQAVHSYQLPADELSALRRRGVEVFSRLPDAVRGAARRFGLI